MKVTVLLDNPQTWFLSHARKLVEDLTTRGHEATLIHDAALLPKGDVAFFLSVEHIIPSEVLKRNTHNIVIHGSAVPQGKGWSPLTWQILEGKDDITVSMFEAAQRVDSGNVYDTEIVHFDGSELIDELRDKQALAIIALALRFIDVYPPGTGKVQEGEESFYPRRGATDSEIDPNKSIVELFNQLRVADNERYPSFFKYRGHTYTLKIYKKNREEK